MAITADGQAPYGSPKSVIDVIQFHRDKRFKGPLDDVTLQRTQIASSSASIQRVRQTLRLLDLIGDDDQPTEALDALATVPEEEFKTRFAEVLEEAYRPIFDVVDPADGYQKVRDAFRGNTPAGQQDRMVTLFLNLCVEAGLISEAPAKPTTDRKPTRESDPKPSGASKRAKKSPARGVLEGATGEWSTRYHALVGLMEKLPVGTGWTRAERDAFYTTFGTVLDFEIEIVPPGGEEGKESQNG